MTFTANTGLADHVDGKFTIIDGEPPDGPLCHRDDIIIDDKPCLRIAQARRKRATAAIQQIAARISYEAML